MMKVKWVTWWPVAYWTERYNELASHVDLEIIFLAKKSSLLDQKADASKWRFSYRWASSRTDSIGYHQAAGMSVRWPKPALLFKGSSEFLIMPYSDPTCVAAAFMSRWSKKKIVLFSPNTAFDAERRRSNLRENLKGKLFRLADAIFVTGPRQHDYSHQYTNDDRKIFTIGNPAPELPGGTEPREVTRARIMAEAGQSGGDIILFVGRLSREKDIKTLLKAQAIVRGAFSICPVVVLVGEGPEEENLRTVAHELKLPVVFAGFQQGSELSNYYAAADLFVLPSTSEPWGLVVNEAMQFGVPVILSDRVGSCPVLLNEERERTGESFSAGNAEALAEKLTKLLGDREYRETLGSNAKRLIQRHSVLAWCNAVVEALEAVSRR